MIRGETNDQPRSDGLCVSSYAMPWNIFLASQKAYDKSIVND